MKNLIKSLVLATALLSATAVHGLVAQPSKPGTIIPSDKDNSQLIMISLPYKSSLYACMGMMIGVKAETGTSGACLVYIEEDEHLTIVGEALSVFLANKIDLLFIDTRNKNDSP